ncbi:MAG TPA: SPOR domain-containing protein [Terracidiphilus sp.]|jgi:DedD protein|nr:SPOR domain-containing protein [Terracidiphilus sp.]
MLREVQDDFESETKQRDVELTLGPAVLLAIACGLLLLCGLCFGVGYTAGRRNGARLAASKEAASGQTIEAQAAASGHKPAATGAPPVVQAASAQPLPAEPPASSTPGNGESPAATQATPANAVRPAMGAETASAQSSNGPTQVQPALPPGSGVMVQVAAVSHVDDANVLMGALRKRGYAVTVRREPDDNLIHVQVGPFASRADANAMSQRLLGDGYNAVVLP